MKNISDRNCRETQNREFILNNFVRDRPVCEICGK